MAPNAPPFLVEDNTDEDFFDNLLSDDDVDVGLVITGAATSSPIINVGNEPDEAKTVANLSISGIGNNSEINIEDDASRNQHGYDDFSGKVVAAVQPDNEVRTLENENLSVSSNSFSFEKLVPDLSDKIEGSDALPDERLINTVKREVSADLIIADNDTSLTGSSGVKEVDWSAFQINAGENSSNGFGSYSDFYSEFGVESAADEFYKTLEDSSKIGSSAAVDNDHRSLYADGVDNTIQYYEGSNNSVLSNQSSNVQDLNASQYWEDQYPGWKYDASSGQWFQSDSYYAISNAQEDGHSNASTWGKSKHSESVYVQQNSQSIAGAAADAGMAGGFTSWNHGAQASDATGNLTTCNQASAVSSDGNGVLSDWNQVSHKEYPPHFVFDPQYPGWYYDTILQKWLILESFTASAQSTARSQNHMCEESHSSSKTFSENDNAGPRSTYGDFNRNRYESSDSNDAAWNSKGNFSSYEQPNASMFVQEAFGTMHAASPDTMDQNMSSRILCKNILENHQHSLSNAVQNTFTENLSHAQGFSMPSQYVLGGNSSHHFNDSKANLNERIHFSSDYHINQNSINFSQQLVQNVQMPYVPASGRSSAERPFHALVTFGFGGKLVVLKANGTTEKMNFVDQNHSRSQLTILNLAEVVNDNFDASIHGRGVNNYFQALCQQSIPGPLTGGSVGMKELSKWIDERTANLQASNMDNRVLQLLLGLLKISCQHYGKLRSPFGSDAALKESDSPESAVARLFASVKTNNSQFSQYAATPRCLQQLPSEGEMQSTAAEIQKLLISGRKREALQCAQEGQLWGPAIVLAAQLGDHFYVETVKQMALRQFLSGSPLRTLCLLIAGCPADAFSAASATSGPVSGVCMTQQPMQDGVNGMLDDWVENLAMITTNRTKDDELLLIHLGDCLWKERSDIIAAHICYLVAEASFEPYSDSARFCLLGADHWKSPRTFASPEAIQRTEIYEYSKTLGNSQFVLLPFQPYKFLYALMLLEVGRISEALKYCQAVVRSLKTGRTAEAENLRHLVSSLEERIKGHQQGGFSTNLAPKEFIGKLLNLFDSTAQRVVGGMPASVPSAVDAPVSNDNNAIGSRVLASQSTVAMSSLVSSESMEPISEWAADGLRKTKHARSVSEPDFGRSPMKGRADTQNESNSPVKASESGITSRFARFNFGTQLLQKTVKLVLKPRQDRQAKLGESNKFYYDEKLKRWVEEGAEPPAAETFLPPPPTSASFQNEKSDFNLQNTFSADASHLQGSPEIKTPNSFDNNSAIPPLPPTANHYSSRGRMGVRSRYVDTFNQGVGNTASKRSPSAPVNPVVGGNTKFFVPASIPSAEQAFDSVSYSSQISSSVTENPSTPGNDSVGSTPSPAVVQRIGSMNNISNKIISGDGAFSVQSRRTASWSGSFNGSFSPPPKTELKPLSEMLDIPPSVMSSDTSGDDLHEVEL